MRRKRELLFVTRSWIIDLSRYCVFLFVMFLFKGCTSDDYMGGDFDENVRALVEPRTAVAISKCVDSYIYWNSEQIYQETHCWTEVVNLGEADNAYSGMEYDPGISNPNGGGYGTQDNPTVFTFSNLNSVYAFGSSLNLKEKVAVESSLNGFRTASPVYPQMYDLLVKNKVKIKFGIDEETCEENEAQAFYSPDSCGIYFKGLAYIDVYTLLEEMIHAVQHQCYYGDNMLQAHKDCEFEAKVLQDLVNLLTYPDLGYVDNIPGMSDANPAFVSAYKEWIGEIYRIGFFPFPEVVNFRDMSSLWNGYSGVNIPTFIPELIKHFLVKQIWKQ